MNLKKIGKLFTSKSVVTGPSSYKKRIYRAAVLQRLRNSVLYNGYRVFPGRKAAGARRWPPTPSIAEVKESVVLSLYFSSGPSLFVIGWKKK